MHPSVRRVAFRGASRYLSANRARPSTVASRPSVKSRQLCSSSAICSDASRKSEQTEVSNSERIASANVESQSESPSFNIIDGGDPISTSVDPMTSVEVEEDMVSDASSATKNEGVPTKRSSSSMAEFGKDTSTLKQELTDTLKRNAVRTALWEYCNNLKSNPLSVDADIMQLMLPVLGRNGWAPTSTETIELAIERNYDLGTSIFNCGLHAMSRSGDHAKMRTIFNDMWKLPKNSHPNATSYNYLIAAYIYRGAVDDAFEVLNEMKKHLIYPTFATYHALITGCLRRRDARRAYSTLLAVEKQRFDISAMTIAQVLVSSANNDDYDHVVHLMSKFEEALPRYSVELHRIAESRMTYNMEGGSRTSKEERAVLRGIPKPEVGAISAVLHSAFRGGRSDIAMKAWALLDQHYPDEEIPEPLWYCMIGAFAGAEKFSEAFDIVATMREAGVSPTLKDLELALTRPISFHVGKIDEVFFRLVDRFEGKTSGETSDSSGGADASVAAETSDSPVDSVSSGEVLVDAASVLSEEGGNIADDDPAAKDISGENSATLGGGDGDLGTSNASVVEEPASESLADILTKPDVAEQPFRFEDRFSPKSVGIEELNVIIAACSTANDLDRAFQTYDEVENRFGFKRNADTFNALLEGCVQTRHVRGGTRVLQEMETMGLPVSGSTLQLACRLLLRAGRSFSAADLIVKAYEEGHEVPLQTQQMLIRHFLRGNRAKNAADLVTLGQKHGVDYRALTGRLDYDSLQMLREEMGEIEPNEGKRNATSSVVSPDDVNSIAGLDVDDSSEASNGNSESVSIENDDDKNTSGGSP